MVNKFIFFVSDYCYEKFSLKFKNFRGFKLSVVDNARLCYLSSLVSKQVYIFYCASREFGHCMSAMTNLILNLCS